MTGWLVVPIMNCWLVVLEQDFLISGPTHDLLTSCLCAWLADWLIGFFFFFAWLVDWLIVYLIGWLIIFYLIGWLITCLFDSLFCTIGRLTDCLFAWLADWLLVYFLSWITSWLFAVLTACLFVWLMTGRRGWFVNDLLVAANFDAKVTVNIWKHRAMARTSFDNHWYNYILHLSTATFTCTFHAAAVAL